MAAEALYAARLLSGEMPEQIEEVFAAAGTSLFPGRRRRHGDDAAPVPDWANPCKHIAAVHYLLGERFDDDPFLMFLLRGRIAGGDRRRAARASRRCRAGAARPKSEPAVEADVATFWSAPPQTDEVALHFALPESDALAVKRLGPPPFVRDAGRRSTTVMERLYQQIGEYALGLALGDGDLGAASGNSAHDDPRPRDARPEQSGQ